MVNVAATNSYSVAGYGIGAQAAPVRPTLSPTSGSAVVNLLMMPNGQQFEGVVTTLFVDNSAGGVPLNITFPDTGMKVIVPAYTQGFYPVITNSLSFEISAPLIGVLGGSMTPTVQVLNFAVAPREQTNPPNLNAGTVANVGSDLGWFLFPFVVPGAQQIYTSLEIDCGAYPAPVSVIGVDIDGNAWTVTQQGFTDSEFSIPPTVAGSPAQARTTLPGGAGSKVIIPTRWRVALAGVTPTSTLPAVATIQQVGFASLTTSPATEFIDFSANDGWLAESVSVFFAGATEAFGVSLVDNNAAGQPVFWTAAFAAGAGQVVGVPLGYTSLGRGDSINVVAEGAADIAEFNLQVQVNVAAVNASQGG